MQQFTFFTFVESSTCSSWCVSNEVFLSEKALNNTIKMEAKMLNKIGNDLISTQSVFSCIPLFLSHLYYWVVTRPV
jgi:hypothetical protein